MSDTMKRKHFHLTVQEEKILYEFARKHHISEAEVVRMAIREFARNHDDRPNALLRMADAARSEQGHSNAPEDLSEEHDRYLREAYEEQS